MKARQFDIAVDNGRVLIIVGDREASFSPADANSIGLALIEVATAVINDNERKAREATGGLRPIAVVNPDDTDRRRGPHSRRPAKHTAN